MTEKVRKQLELLKSQEYKKHRKHIEDFDAGDSYKATDDAELFRRFVGTYEPVFMGDSDRMGFYHSNDIKTNGCEGNVTPNFSYVLANGFKTVRNDIKKSMDKTTDEDKLKFGRAMLSCIETVTDFTEKYRSEAEKRDNKDLYNALGKIPENGAESFYEACVFLKLLIFFLRVDFINHLGFGRFDQYMYPYFQNDRKKGITDEELFETLEEFFIAINFDTDLYFGLQKGDNGQSMVLGGYDETGNSCFNDLTKMCMDASLELSLIDPKINLRVCDKTPIEVYEYATRLTKQGLGFPQYCNDDVVIDGLVKLGYSREDAANYTVAACWEFIIPGKSADIPNIGALNFPELVNNVIHGHLKECDTFDALKEKVKEAIINKCEETADHWKNLNMREHPLLSVFFDGCTESLQDLFHYGAKYSNYGCQGVGIANGADALCAVKKTIYDDKIIEKDTLLEALSKNFEGFSEIRNILIGCPKVGNNDAYADDIMMFLMKVFSENMNNRDNYHNGVWRAGTGSANMYINTCPATADGRLADTPYSASYSPSLNIKTDGLLSVIQSFTKFNLSDIINGGPLTIEVHDTVLRNDIGISKTAMLVKEFIHLGGHQLQINAVNHDKLCDAKKHPEKYPDLIVRVWGWSGYFCELDPKYQDQIILRTEYKL